MGKKHRETWRAHRDKQVAHTLGVYEPMTHWERANRAYFWCFGIHHMAERYDEDDAPFACEMAVTHFLHCIYLPECNNPLKRLFSFQELIDRFNECHPLKETVE